MHIKKRIAAGLIISLSLFAGMTATVLAFNTILAFSTPAAGLPVPVGGSLNSIPFPVNAFRKIRVVAAERPGSPTNTRVILNILENGAVVGQLDVINLTPNSRETRFYEVPGRTMRITVQAAAGGVGTDTVDVLVFGSD